jgi:hypothetical protein
MDDDFCRIREVVHVDPAMIVSVTDRFWELVML